MIPLRNYIHICKNNKTIFNNYDDLLLNLLNSCSFKFDLHNYIVYFSIIYYF